MKHQLHILLIVAASILMLPSCKKTDNKFYEYSSPTFKVIQKEGAAEEFYSYCASHEVYMDSIYVTSPLNIRSRHYFHGQTFQINEQFLIADTFIPHAGKWQFVFYGRKLVNGMGFKVFIEKEF
ncbi:MAG: hypothetical protein HQ565_08970 [Bacteroidetes bacterium]|nr:hypothetical protein [Bacteroidota bacterium]